MEVSPLTQQARPSSFKPKIAHLYEDLFRDDVETQVDSEGFWLEFFLLKPDRGSLQHRLDELQADDLLHFQHESQQLFARSVQQLKAAKAPLDENALDTLTVFLGAVLAKRYTNPSADIIAALAGLDDVDAVFFDFANAIEGILRNGRSFEIREKATEVALSLVAGAYQTSLVSYLTHRDLFPALMKHMHETPTNPAVFKPFLLLGLLANYNKFEFRNPYRLRLGDFVNESAIQKVVYGFGSTCALSRDRYIAIQEDVNEGWTLATTLSYIGLGALAPSKPQTMSMNDDAAKEAFAHLPGPEASILLSAYDFANANTLFMNTLLSIPPAARGQEAPLSSFLSYTSYLLHHAHRSSRCTLYSQLSLSILRLMLEDSSLAKQLSTPAIPIPVRLCRQIPPFLPSSPKPRPPIETVLDLCIDSLTHNLRLRLDAPLYTATLNLTHRILAHLISTRTRLRYHWSLLWQSLLSLLRFLNTYAPTIQSQHGPEAQAQLLHPFLATLALAVSDGDAFLPDPPAFDDLFYKLVQAGHLLPAFKNAYLPDPSPTNDTPSSPSAITPLSIHALNLLIHVSTHYHTLLSSSTDGDGGKPKTLSPKEVAKVIRAGYETLQLPALETGGGGGGGGAWGGARFGGVGGGLLQWEPWREGTEKAFLKKAARAAVEDGRRVVRVGR